MELDLARHSDEIATKLRSFVEVRPFDAGSLVARPEFWSRCRLMKPKKRPDTPRDNRIYVDGFAGACHWNSLQVHKNSTESGLGLWSGFALHGGTWYAHSWCMIEEQIVESTAPFQLYFGARLTPDEVEHFQNEYGTLSLDSPKRKCVITTRGGCRQHVWEDLNALSRTIGRQRDWETGEVLDGLRR